MIDRLGRDITYLRISVTDKCNLRCRYCMPEEGVCKKNHEDMLTEDEIIQAVEAAAALGIRKIRITGGEPLVKKNIVSICRRTAAVEGINEVCLTTNGILLPQLAKDLKAAGVKRINLSLDTLDPEKYTHITRIGKLENFQAGLEAAFEAGFEKIKVNAVLIGGFFGIAHHHVEFCNGTVVFALIRLVRRADIERLKGIFVPMETNERHATVKAEFIGHALIFVGCDEFVEQNECLLRFICLVVEENACQSQMDEDLRTFVCQG